MRRALLALALLSGVAAPVRGDDAEGESSVRKVVIAPFGGAAGTQARTAVLEEIAGRTDRTDFTVLGHGDIEITAKRLGIKLESDAGREAISKELQIEQWIDGELDKGGDGEVRLTTSKGKQLAVLLLKEHSAEQSSAKLREQIWRKFGPHLSRQELVARKLEQQQELAKVKLAAREQELVRQRQLVVAHAEQRLKMLDAARALAKTKLKAREDELARQAGLVRDRRMAEAREQQRQQQEMQRKLAEEQRQQQEMQRQAEEEARRQQLAQQQAMMQQQAAAQPAYGSWQQPPPQQPPGQWQPPPQQPGAAPAPGQWQPPPPQQPGAAPPPEGVSPETREWLLRKQRERAGGAQPPQ